MKAIRNLTAFQLIYGIIMVVFFTISLLISAQNGTDKTVILARRVLISMFFLVLGGVFLKFKEKLAEFFYVKKDVTAFKNEEGRQKAIDETRYLGMFLFITGVSVLTFAVILFFLSQIQGTII